MLWDPSFSSWAQLGVSGQPAWLLVGPDGRLVDGTYGAVPTDRVLELSDALASTPSAQ